MSAESREGCGACFACTGVFNGRAGPTHRYMLSTPGCWAAYGEVLVREYQNPLLFGAVHRLTVDAYALQHPGDPADRRATRSVWIHYAALQLAFEQQCPLAAIPAIMQRLARMSFPALPPAPSLYEYTHASVLAEPADGHVSAVKRWARCAYHAWDALYDPTKAILRDA